MFRQSCSSFFLLFWPPFDGKNKNGWITDERKKQFWASLSFWYSGFSQTAKKEANFCWNGRLLWSPAGTKNDDEFFALMFHSKWSILSRYLLPGKIKRSLMLEVDIFWKLRSLPFGKTEDSLTISRLLFPLPTVS